MKKYLPLLGTILGTVYLGSVVAAESVKTDTKQNVKEKKAHVEKSKAVMADMTVTEKITPTAKERYKLPTT